MTASTEPLELIAGNSASWTQSLNDYKPSDGWLLEYYFTNKAAATFKIACTQFDVSTHLATLTSVQSTAGFTIGGEWQWYAVVTKDLEKITVERGSITITPAISVGTITDTRTYAQKLLDAVEATLQNRATNDQLGMSYSTPNGSRSIQHSSLSELMALRADLRRQVDAENGAESMGLGRNFNVRFVRV